MNETASSKPAYN